MVHGIEMYSTLEARQENTSSQITRRKFVLRESKLRQGPALLAVPQRQSLRCPRRISVESPIAQRWQKWKSDRGSVYGTVSPQKVYTSRWSPIAYAPMPMFGRRPFPRSRVSSQTQTDRTNERMITLLHQTWQRNNLITI